MSRSFTAAVLALALAATIPASLSAIRNKPQGSAKASTESPQTPAELLARGQALLTEADGLDRTSPKQARKAYERALTDLQRAAALAPGDYYAHNYVGYALRKLGRYEAALASYDRALALAPNFPDAIEYRAETYLVLNRIDEARQAYMHLFVYDRVAAGVLMKAMKTWVEARRARPAGVDAATLDAFASWVHERDQLAGAVVNLGHNSPDWK